MGRKHRKKFTLSTVPESEWKAFADKGFDILWLMGVWKRSPSARAHSLRDPGLREVYDKLLPGWKEEDVAGSPYAVYDYSLDPALGSPDDLAKLRRTLNRLGLRLFVDYVPNHLALDHPLTAETRYFIKGNRACHKAEPELFYRTEYGTYLAHGKDPYFAPWCDTVQINFFSGAARELAKKTLLSIAGAADGVRCDMAMLALNEVFEKTWGPFLGGGRSPQPEFWTEVLGAVRSRHRDFLFMAEAYWDTEYRLQQLGFDFTYDKRLYDRLVHDEAPMIHGHFLAEPAYQERSVRFIENHDEPRAVSLFGPGKSRAAAMITVSVPGLRFIHDGQTAGKKRHLPVHLGSEPLDEHDPAAEAFYEKLLRFCSEDAFHEGEWTLLKASPAWEGNPSCERLLAWAWRREKDLRIMVINYSASLCQARLRLPAQWLEEKSWLLLDEYSGERFERDTAEIRRHGLYIELGAWDAHWFRVTPEERGKRERKPASPMP